MLWCINEEKQVTGSFHLWGDDWVNKYSCLAEVFRKKYICKLDATMFMKFFAQNPSRLCLVRQPWSNSGHAPRLLGQIVLIETFGRRWRKDNLDYGSWSKLSVAEYTIQWKWGAVKATTFKEGCHYMQSTLQRPLLNRRQISCAEYC